MEYEHSLNALYKGDISQEDAITHLTGKLDILPAVLERKPLVIDEALLSLVRSFENCYDIILIDTAPVGLVANTMSLNRLADTAIVVVRFDGAQLEKIRESLIRLEKSDMDIMGCIINGVKNLGNKGNDYYHYGSRYKKPSKKNHKSEQQQEWEEWERKHIADESVEADEDTDYENLSVKDKE